MFSKGLKVLDAIRISDNQKVVLKKVRTASYEIPVAQLLSSPALRNDPRNHTIPLLDVIPLPADDDWALLVMPALLEFQKLPFRRVGEFCEAAMQYLQVRSAPESRKMVIFFNYIDRHWNLCMSITSFTGELFLVD
jgi:hypothetical protein